MNIGPEIKATGSGWTIGNNRMEKRWGDVPKQLTHLYGNTSLQKHQCTQIHTNIFWIFIFNSFG